MWDCLLHNHHSIPPIVICPSLTLMYCVKIEKVWEHQKYETIAWLVIGLCMIQILCVVKMDHSQTIWFLGIAFFSHVIFRRHDCLVSMLEVLLFLCQYELLSWIFRIWIFKPWLRRFTLKLSQSITPHQEFSFYHLPTRGRVGIKLGDAWYISNVSIIFDCSMLYYLLF